MAQLTGAAYETKYNDSGTGIYRDGQGVGAITEEDHRTQIEDLVDSFQNKIENIRQSSVVGGGAVALNFNSENTHKNFVLSSGISGALTWSLAGSGVADKFTALFHLAGTGVHTFPAIFKMSHPDWSSSGKTLTFYDTGYFKLEARFDGVYWFADVAGPYV